MTLRPTILIIDDDEAIRDSCTQALLREARYAVALAPDGEAGLDMVARFDPDLALVDMRMPGVSGIELIRRIKKLNPELPVVVITGYPSGHSAAATRQVGARDYLAKPFTPGDLNSAIARALKARRPPQGPDTKQPPDAGMNDESTIPAAREILPPLVRIRENLQGILFADSEDLSEAQRTQIKRIFYHVIEIIDMTEDLVDRGRASSDKKQSRGTS